ncbi:DUF2892 domain-containing protein [Nocardia noduli]|uniref:YgaP family membrane protein n=1 Tax=Nocardia noduli TaxID=2815722 RepID=UPI0027DFB5AE|nr:DUF2892 domain-containing protein [Nocardia noduli]
MYNAGAVPGTDGDTDVTTASSPRLLAGFVVLVGTLLAATVSPWWLLLTGFAGANLVLYGTIGWCPASLLMARLGLPTSANPYATPRP